MRSLNKAKFDVNSRLLILLGFFTLSIILLILQLPVSAANTFPHQYELVSVNNVDGRGVNRHARVKGVSINADKILFESTASNLPQSSSTPSTQIGAGYMRDMSNSTTTRVDLSASGIVPDKATSNHVMSITGRYVAFDSSASNLIDGSPMDNSVSRVYFKDLQTGAVELIVNIPYSVVNGYGTSSMPISVSDDGRYLLVITNRVNSLLPGTRAGNGGGYRDVVMYDRVKSMWTLINSSVDGIAQNQNIENPKANCDGSLVVFESTATNLISSYSGSGKHIFVADIRNGLHIIDLTQGAITDSTVPQISCNGRYITYSTSDRTLLPTPAGMSTYPQLVRYDRFTGERKYISSDSSNANFRAGPLDWSTEYYRSSVSDNGDVVMPYTSLVILGSPLPTVQFKHLSDGSGTLENVQHNYAGLKYDPTYLPMISPDGRYVVVSSNNGDSVGVNVDPGIFNILRIKTGL